MAWAEKPLAEEDLCIECFLSSELLMHQSMTDRQLKNPYECPEHIQELWLGRNRRNNLFYRVHGMIHRIWLRNQKKKFVEKAD